MSLLNLYYVLWILPVPVFVWLTVTMRRRKVQREFPLFFAFVIFQIADFAIGFYTHHRSEREYFYAYWTLAALGVGLGFGVIYEVFTNVFRPFAGLRELGAILFRWAALVLLLAAALLATTARTGTLTPVFATILNCMRSIEVMQCGLVLLMLLCSNYLGITLKHRIFGIALGFGVIAAVDLIAVAVLANLGVEARVFFQVSKMLAYNVAALLWLGYVHAGEVVCSPAKQLAYAERWDYALDTVVHPNRNAPALPFIEDTVEKVWMQVNGPNKVVLFPPHSADQ